MHLSVANARPRNHEKTGVSGLIPTHLRSGSTNLISLLKEYYEFMNQDSQVGISNRLSHIVDENDIDETSEEYLDAIQAEIASVVPNSDYMDRVTLYKRIVHYYKSKGTLEAVTTFFRIFFNTTVSVEYFPEIPWTYSIKTRSLNEGWKERYKKLAHPAGLKFLVGILIDSTIRGGGYEGDAEYDSSKILAGWDADFWNKRRESYIDTDVFTSSSLTAHLPITSDYSDNTNLTEIQSDNSSFASFPSAITPEADGSYTLDGSTDYISSNQIPPSSFYADMDWTISFIYKGTDSSTPILQDSNNNFAIQITSIGGLQCAKSSGIVTPSYVGSPLVNDGENHFCVVENRSGNLTIFVDGFTVIESSGFFDFSGLTNIDELMRSDYPVHTAPNGAFTYTSGTLKEFRFHNRVFSVEQIRQLDNITSTIGGDLTLRNWLYDLVPPSNRDGVFDSQYDAFHIPKYQPGWLPEGDIVQLLLTFIGDPELDETDYARLVDLNFGYIFQPEESRDDFFRRNYQGMMKFFDPGPLSGIGNKTIGDAIASEEGLDDEFRLFSFGADVDSIPYTLSSSVDSQDEGSAFTVTLNSNSTVASGTIVNYEFEGISPEDVDELDSQDFNPELLIGNGFFVTSPKVYDGTSNLFEIPKDDVYYYDTSTYIASDRGTIGSPDIDVTFDASTGSNGSDAQGYPVIDGGQIRFVVITDDGYDYQGGEGITFANPAHDGSSPVRTGIYDITTGGSGFTDGSYSLTISAPEALKVGHGGVQATATCTVSGGAITAITITNPGLGYTASPTVSLDGAGPGSWSPTVTLIDSTNGTHMSDSQVIPYFEKATGSIITSSDDGNVELVSITNRGNGYSVEPPVGNGSDFIGFDSQTGLTFDYLRPYPSDQDTFTLTNDTTTEGSETFKLYLDENPTISVSVVINDTST